MNINFDKVPKYIRDELDKGPRQIARGRTGKRVRQVQEWLRYHNCRTSIDGDFGPATAACVRDFQTKKRLRVSGVVDNKTWNALVEPMRLTLQPPRNIERLSPPQAIRRVAKQHLKQHPIEIGGENRGPWVRLYCQGNDGRAWAWCAGFTSLIMLQAYFYLGRKAPLRGSVSCDSLAAQAKDAGLFVSERDITSGRVDWRDFQGCCLFLKRRTATDWVHAGYALDASGPIKETVFNTIEGNTNDEGSRDGFEACERTRGVVGSHYDFVALA